VDKSVTKDYIKLLSYWLYSTETVAVHYLSECIISVRTVVEPISGSVLPSME